jgi:NADH:ubiquinone oxidoreductase subunit 6 (subunit J)
VEPRTFLSKLSQKPFTDIGGSVATHHQLVVAVGAVTVTINFSPMLVINQKASSTRYTAALRPVYISGAWDKVALRGSVRLTCV